MTKGSPMVTLEVDLAERPTTLRRTAGLVGTVFEVEEFAVHDGPGIRTTVFLKGCPLRCTWCHNPEGVSPQPEALVDRLRCARCGGDVDVRSGRCPSCGAVVDCVPLRLRQISGTRLTVDELAERLLRNRDLLQRSGGGVTFSGGEPLAQATFLRRVVEAIRPLHVAVETSGQASPAVFRRVIEVVDLVMIDIKHTDTAVHRRFTGVGNERILANLRTLCDSTIPFVVRVPLIPGVNDSAACMESTAQLLVDAPALERVELMPFNTMAPAKYARLGLPFRPGFDVNRHPEVHLAPFERRAIPCEVL